MKKKNNTVLKLNNNLDKMNQSVRKVVQNDLVINIVRVVLIVYTSFLVPLLNNNTLESS